jgi:glutathione S-transferase
MANELTFYTSPMSRGRTVRWLLEEMGVPYETVLLDFRSTMKGDDYKRINPIGKVPAIVHRGHVVTETAAIILYLADAYPDAKLGPTADERADYYRWILFAAGPAEQGMLNRFLGFEIPPERQAMIGYGNFDRLVDALEHGVAAHEYIAGDRFTAADVYVGAQLNFGLEAGMLPKREIFQNYVARLWSRPAHVRARGIDDALLAKQKAGG